VSYRPTYRPFADDSRTPSFGLRFRRLARLASEQHGCSDCRKEASLKAFGREIGLVRKPREHRLLEILRLKPNHVRTCHLIGLRLNIDAAGADPASRGVECQASCETLPLDVV